MSRGVVGSVTPWFRLVRFSHTLFALPFALVGLAWGFASTGTVSLHTVLLVLVCMVLARNTAMGYNRLLDRKIDALNPRTMKREIPMGTISVRGGAVFVAVNAALFVLATFFLNSLTFYLSPVALLLLLGYSHTKRFTWLCHFWLGLTLALAPLGAFVAATGHFDLYTLLLAIGVLLWVGGFDIVYSLQDAEFDRAHHLFSIPVAIGVGGAIWLARVAHLLAIALFTVAFRLMGIGVWGVVGILLFASVLVWQHTLFSPTRLERIDGRFMLTNGINSIILSMVVIAGIVARSV